MKALNSNHSAVGEKKKREREKKENRDSIPQGDRQLK
jgi:hypothetical protein